MCKRNPLVIRSACLALLAFMCTQASLAQDNGGIHGTVYNASGDLALDAKVRIIGMGRLTSVDSEAGFVFENLPSGSYILEAISPRWGHGIAEVDVQGGQTAEIRFEVLTHIDMDDVVVSAGLMGTTHSQAVQPTDALSYQDLIDASAASLGESLKGKVGVTSTYFGPGSSRPVIRGVSGNRVSVLQQGLSTADVSDISPDHAPAVEALLADRIEFIRGPATLLYGSSAIGGVVNVYGSRVPSEKPTSAFEGAFIGRASSVSQGRTGALKLRGAAGNFAWNVSGLSRATEEFRVPEGSILEEDDHGDDDDHHGDDDDDGDDHDDDGDDHDDDDDHHEEGASSIANSNISLNTATAGLSYIGSWGFIGAAVTTHGTGYGLPGHAHHGEHHDEEEEHEGEEEEHEEEEEEEHGVRVDMEKVSVNLEGHWRAHRGFLHGVRFRFGSTAYGHDELEGDVVGTTFGNDLLEGRIEIDHELSDRFQGVAGLHMDRRELTLEGEEAYMPGVNTSSFALFLLERVNIGSLNLEAGARYEYADFSPETGNARSFGGVSLGLGVNYQSTEALTFAFRSASNIKIPHPGELYAQGLHVATQAYEIGRDDLNIEKAFSLDASVYVRHNQYTASASIFSNRFTDFIYLRHTQEEIEGAAVFHVDQAAARFRGFEAEVEGVLFHSDPRYLSLRVWSDYTTARRTDRSEPLPRIPPLRVGGELTYSLGAIDISTSLKSVRAQDRVARYEEPTSGYMHLGASARYKFFLGGTGHIVSLQGRNLTNAIARPHTSFLKDLVPLPGRDIRLTYRMLF